MGHDQAAYKKADNSYQGGFLKVTQSGNGMARGATPGISGAEAHQKSGNDQYRQPLKGYNRIPVENFRG